MQDQKNIGMVKDVLLTMAEGRSNQIAANMRGEKYNQACDALLQPLVHQHQSGETTYYGLQLPQCFPSMTKPDILTILEWHVTEGSTIRPGRDLLEVHSNYGDILIPMHPDMRGPYRVVEILHPRDAQVQMGDLLVVLQAIAQKTLKEGKMLKRKVA